MAKGDVELARAGYEAVNEAYRTGDWGPFMQHAETAFDPDIVLEDGSESGTFTEGEWRGVDGLVGFIGGQTDVLEDMWVRPEEFIEVGDRLVVPLTFGGRATHTGIPVELSVVHVFTMRDGRGVRLQLFRDRDQALAAAHS